MRSPQIVILEHDGWLAKQLRELAGESRWLVQSARTVDAALAHVRRQPTVLLVQFEPGEDKPKPLELVAESHRVAPDVPVIAVADVKMLDADRAAWTAALFDLGVRFFLFPPLTKPVLEDVVSGLMSAAIRRSVGEAPPPRGEPVLDLAEGGADA